MTETIAGLPEEDQQEDQLIRKLLAHRNHIMRPFPQPLEQLFWQSLADRSWRMIRDIAMLGMLIYILVGLITFATVYTMVSGAEQLHDILIWLLLYLNGAVCLAALPVMAYLPGLNRYFKPTIIVLSFLGIFFTTLLTLQFNEPRLIQHGSYIVIFVYMLIYFLTGLWPLTLWFTCLIAGLLPLPLAWLMQIQVDLLQYFYAVIFSNFIGFFISQSILGKERISFLQARLLELGKTHSARMRKELIRLSNEDPLIGLYNRRYFNQMLQQEWERAIRSTESISLVFIDIDCFKNYNDTYGHLKGDQALMKVGEVLLQQVRRSADMAARYGGEEFILLLPNTASSGAQVVANNIMRAIDALKIEHRSSSAGAYLSLSIGVATWHGEPDVDETQLIARADMAMYQAKANGRHRICVFGEAF